jgi:tripartite-type tricarboxylate transporter receptor subunit TctC
MAGLAGCSSITGGGGGGEYPSQDITWIVPFGAGGGYDAYSRAIGQYMPEYLPNDVNINVENRPGGGSRTGTQAVWRADPDGYTLGMIDTVGNAAYQTVIEPDFDTYDITEFSYFGTAAWEPYGFWTAWDSEYETVEDLQNADLIRMATSGLGSAASNAGVVANAVMEIPSENVFGYDGTAESMTAVIRGDADIVPVNSSSARSAYEDQELRPIVVFDDSPIEWASESQAAGELGYDAVVAVGRFERALGAPPDTEQAIIDTLEGAWLDLVEDDEFNQWSEENNRPIRPKNAQETEETTRNAVETFEGYRDLFARIRQE